MKNIVSLNDFKGKKSPIQESEEQINEMVDAIDDFYRVSVDVDLPKSLISSFIKKVKESTGKDLRAEMGEKRLAERLVQWANENYLNIENLPVEIVTGSDKAPVQGQGAQAQSQVQEEPAQTQAQVQPSQAQAQPAQPAQPVQNTEAQKPAVQVQGQQKAQATAQAVPAQEI